MTNRRLSCVLASLALSLLLAGGCDEDERRKIGASCAEGDQCASGFCYYAECLDPDGDEEPDGLINRLEAALGTNPFLRDSDGDGIDDIDEVGDDPTNPVDTDGDGKIDAVESAIADADGDCIPDQFDPHDDVVETDMDVVARLACLNRGVCEGAPVEASCESPDGEEGAGGAPVLSCDYSGVADYEADTETRCDGLDNDCDGRVDEGLTYLDRGEAKSTGSSCRGVGACSEAEGTVECRASDGASICSVNLGGSDFAGADEEISCNGIDDDCDGQTDEGVTWTDPNGEEIAWGEECFAAGVCGQQPGTVECGADGGEGVCSTEPGGSEDRSGEEVCDNLDNDCDGLVDEGLEWESPSGDILAVGDACGLGACEGGIVQCRGGEPTCSTFDQSTGRLQLCNGVDDDCDGQTDEADGLALACPDEGVCTTIAPAEVFCSGDLVVCDYVGVDGYETEEVSCNGLDDDCDGATDEGLTTDDGLALGEPCQGQGACAEKTGTVVCDPDPAPETSPSAVCSADLEGETESCNGLDDDCDGQIDEGVVPPGDLGCLTEGLCAAYTEDAATCVDGSWRCPHLDDPDFEPVEATCDLVDNDCDGLVDDGVPKRFTGGLVERVGVQPSDRQRWPMVVPDDGQPFLFGGLQVRQQGSEGSFDVGVALGDAWRYGPDDDAWAPVSSDGPGPRAGHAMTWEPDSGVVLVHGGFDTFGGGSSMDLVEGGTDIQDRSDMWAYDPVNDEWSFVSQSTDPVRSHHSITAIGGGQVVLHGGQTGDQLPQTLLGTLTESAGVAPGYSIQWDPDVPQGDARYGHTATWDASAGRVVIAGGRSPALDQPLPVAAAWTGLPEDSWTSFGGDNDQPLSRVNPAAVVAGGVLYVYGGRGLLDPYARGELLDDAWQIPLEAEAAWSPFDAPADLGPHAGAAAWATEGPTLHLAGGAGPFPVSQRRSFSGNASGTWEGTPWSGPAPRVGATIVVRPDDGAAWLIGGHRVAGDYPLQDVWTLVDAFWSPAIDATPPGGPVDSGRPAVREAAGLWDPIGDRVLLYGGVGPDGEPSDVLWSWSPGEGTFAQPDDQGDVPPPAHLSHFVLDAGGTDAWLLVGEEVEPGASDMGLSLYRLELATLTWTEAWSWQMDVPGPGFARQVAGGVPSDGSLEVLVYGSQGSFQLWRWADGGWSDEAFLDLFYPELLGAVYDPASRRTLLLAGGYSEVGQVSVPGFMVDLVEVDHAEKSFDFLGSGEAWPQAAQGSGLVVHPSLGVLGFGGQGPTGHTHAEWFIGEQVCE